MSIQEVRVTACCAQDDGHIGKHGVIETDVSPDSDGIYRVRLDYPDYFCYARGVEVEAA